MDIFVLILLPIVAYAFGSISSAVWVANTFYKTDIRQHGSKNAGATNVLRVLGVKAAIPVFAFDVFKGVAAVLLIHFTNIEKGTELYTFYEIVLGTAAILGHIFPLFASFKGGKGVATITGVMLAIFPAPTLICFGIFIVCFLLSHYVSLSSITACVSFPFIVIFLFGCWLRPDTTLTMKVFSCIAAILIVITHRKNITRLLNGTESKISFSKKKTEA